MFKAYIHLHILTLPQYELPHTISGSSGLLETRPCAHPPRRV